MTESHKLAQAQELVLAISKMMDGEEPNPQLSALDRVQQRQMAIDALKEELVKLEPNTVRYKWFGVADPDRAAAIRMLRRGVQALYADAVLQHAQDHVRDQDILSWIRHNVKAELRKAAPKFW